MEATRIGVPRRVSAQAGEQSKTVATIIDRSCMDFNLAEYVISMTTTSVETLLATSYIDLISCNMCGSMFPPLMIATFIVVLGNWS